MTSTVSPPDTPFALGARVRVRGTYAEIEHRSGHRGHAQHFIRVIDIFEVDSGTPFGDEWLRYGHSIASLGLLNAGDVIEFDAASRLEHQLLLVAHRRDAPPSLTPRANSILPGPSAPGDLVQHLLAIVRELVPGEPVGVTTDGIDFAQTIDHADPVHTQHVVTPLPAQKV